MTNQPYWNDSCQDNFACAVFYLSVEFKGIVHHLLTLILLQKDYIIMDHVEIYLNMCLSEGNGFSSFYLNILRSLVTGYLLEIFKGIIFCKFALKHVYTTVKFWGW